MRDEPRKDTLRIVGVRGGDFVLLAGATWKSPDGARAAFDSVPRVEGGDVLLELCNRDGDIFEDKAIGPAEVEAILADVDGRRFADILATAPILDR